MARQVIIGNSAAGMSAIKAIREVNSSCPITLISEENYNTYSRVLLTYYLKGRISRKDLFLIDSDFYKLNRVRTLFGSKAVEVDTLKHKVRLESGASIEYDNLLIATGASAVSLESTGEQPANALSLRTIDDADKIAEYAKTVKEVIIIGGGLVALQITDALLREGVKLTILVNSRQLLSQNIGADCAAIVQEEIESHGVSIQFGKAIREVRKKGKKAIVISNLGEEQVADLVIIGKGVRPNTQLVNNSGIKMNTGILVDELMQTNIDNIFAAGDVSEGKNLVSGKREILPTWSNACKQGRIAGLNMAGSRQRYEGGLRQNVSTIFGLTIVSIGLSTTPENEGTEVLLFFDPQRRVYRRILLADNKVIGVVMLNRTGDAGIFGSLIKNRKDISPWKEGLARTSLDMKKLLSSIANRRYHRTVYS